MASGQSYGQTLPDQVERIASLFECHIELFGDVRELYREQAAIEREYAGKLQLLAKKAAEKKAKAEAAIVVGSEPTKVWNENTLRTSTLNRAYGEIVTALSSSAQEHVDIADEIQSQVIEPLKAAERKNDETRKKELQFFQKLLSDRDRMYGEHTKSKQKYDEECTEVESHRQKQGKAQDDRHAERATKQYDQQRNDMLNSKNVYIIAMTVANKAKARFYDEDLPGLEDQFQALQSLLIQRCVKILLQAQAIQIRHLDARKRHLTDVEKTLGDVDTSADQAKFIEHNIRPFKAPGDLTFEPCSIHYDTADMSVEPAPKIFLQNKLSKCRGKLEELSPLIDTKRRELEKSSKLFHACVQGDSSGNVDTLSDGYIEASHQLTFFSISEHIVNAEIDVILEALGGDEGAQQPHSFKGSSFSIPTQCGYCKNSIWGLSKQGKTCKLCSLSVHSKCELKVPAECPGSHVKNHSVASSRASTITRADTRGSTRSSFSAAPPSASSFVTIQEAQEAHPAAQVLFDYSATSPFELKVKEGTSVHVIEEDDGSGWVKVADSQGGKGLVPASYIKLVDEADSEPAPPPLRSNTRPQRGSGKRVRGLYEYDAQGSDELGIKVGELIELSAGPNGGENYGEGWWEGINAKGQKGIFPSNYVELV